ncbi:MAG: hypothetical protein DWQ04_23920 [Chloroflexi bacterium]|nr:MAG: hypothetical protein DWQ04_23920 [Chloroflexota bacterium]
MRQNSVLSYDLHWSIGLIKRPFHENLIAALILIGLLLILFARQIFGGNALLASDLIFKLDPVWQASAPATFTIPDNELLSDQVYQFYPWSHFTFESIRNGEFPPLWNPYSYAGTPFLANAQSALFSPFRLLTYLFPLNASFIIMAVTQLFVAGYGTYLFGRVIKLSHMAALLAMITFTLSGPVLVWLLYPLSLTYVWLPLLMWVTERWLVRKSWAAVLWPALIIGCQFLGGNPEASFYLLVLWAFYVAFRLFSTTAEQQNLRQWWQYNRIVLAQVFMALAAGFALAAIQLLPFLAYLPHSSVFVERSSANSGNLFRTIFLSWQAWPDVITAVFPRFFGTPVNRSYWYPFSNYARQTLYVGVVPLLVGLATAVPLWRKRKQDPEKQTAIFFLIMGILFFGIALRLPLFELINQLPLFNLAMPDRTKIEYAFCLAIVAGFGFDYLREAWEKRPFSSQTWRWYMRLSVGLIGIGLIVVAGSYIGLGFFRDTIVQIGETQAIAAKQQRNILFPASLDYYLQQVAIKYEQMRALFTIQNPVMFLPVLVGGILLGGRRRWQYLLVVVTAVDLLAVHVTYFPAIPPEHIYPAPQIISQLPVDAATNRVAGLDLALMPNSSVSFNLADIRGYDPMTPWRYLELVRSATGYTRVSHYALFRQPDERLFDLLNVKYILTTQLIDNKWEHLSPMTAYVHLYQNNTALPRAYLVTDAIFVKSSAASLQQINNPAFDIASQVILEGTSSSPVTPFEGNTGEVQINTYHSDYVEIQTVTNQPAYLVLSDTYMPGWHVSVDGEEAELLIANHAFRAVVVPAGEHLVSFTYRPISFVVGRAVSATMALIFIISGLFNYRTRTKK